LVAEIAEFDGAWRALDTLAPVRLPNVWRAATIERIGSSQASSIANSLIAMLSDCRRDAPLAAYFEDKK
jgi:hypothetical protein